MLFHPSPFGICITPVLAFIIFNLIYDLLKIIIQKLIFLPAFSEPDICMPLGIHIADNAYILLSSCTMAFEFCKINDKARRAYSSGGARRVWAAPNRVIGEARQLRCLYNLDRGNKLIVEWQSEQSC